MNGLPEATEVRGVLHASHPGFAGHFPGAPIAAGVLVLGRVLHAFRDRYAHARVIGIPSAKFPAPLRPGDAYCVRFEWRNPVRVAFECRRDCVPGPNAPAVGLPDEGERRGADYVVARGELEVDVSEALPG